MLREWKKPTNGEFWDEGKCAYCREPFDLPHTDALHRYTPLCSKCYADPERRKATEWKRDAD